MRQGFGFDLSMEAVRLMKRGDGFWYEEAVEKIDGPDIIARLEALAARVPAGEPVEIFLPGDQILYVDVPVRSHETAAKDIRAALDGRTPYSIDELEFDWVPVTDKMVRVAAIARDTLDEAAAFAEVRGLVVGGYSSLADASSFPRLPDFGSGVEDWGATDSGPALVLVGHPIAEADEDAPDEDALPLPDAPVAEEDAGTEIADATQAEADEVEASGALLDETDEVAEVSDTGDAALAEDDADNLFLDDTPAPDVVDEDEGEPGDDDAADAPTEDEVVGSDVAGESIEEDVESEAPEDEPENLAFAEDEDQGEDVDAADDEDADDGENEPDDLPVPVFRSARDETVPVRDDIEDTTPVIVVEDAAPVIATAPDPAPVRPAAPRDTVETAEPSRVADSLKPRVDPIAAWTGREPKKARLGLPVAAAIAGLMTVGIGWVVWSILPEGAPPEVTATAPVDTPVIEGPGARDGADDPDLAGDDTPAPAVPDLPQPDAVASAPAGPGTPVGDELALDARGAISDVARGPTSEMPAVPVADVWLGPEEVPEPTPDTLLAASEFDPVAGLAAVSDPVEAPGEVAAVETIERASGVEPLTDVPRDEVFAALAPPPAEDFRAETPLAEPTGDAAALIASALPAPTELARALTDIAPRQRPGRLVESYERAMFGGRTRAELALIRPPARPASAQTIATAALGDAGPAAGASLAAGDDAALFPGLQPRNRPEDFEATVQDTIARQASLAPPPDTSAAVRAALARPPSAPDTDTEAVENARESARMVIPSGVSVARRATIENVFDMRNLALVGIYGSTNDRRALLRLANGRYVKVKTGDRVDGGTITAINASSVTYRKGGRNTALQMPGG